jgi:hypothetical protein
LEKSLGWKMIGMTAIRVKRGIQWDRAQIMVLAGSTLFFLNPVDLYFDLKNTAVLKCPNS